MQLFALFAFILSAGPFLASAQALHPIATQAQTIGHGKFYISNAKTGQYLSYTRDERGHSLQSTHDEPSAFSIKTIGRYTVISPTSSKNKCLSSHYDTIARAPLSVALFACRATDFKRKRRLGRDSFPETDKENARQSIFESRADFETRIWEEEVLADRKALAAMEEFEKSGTSLVGLTKQYFYLVAGSQKNAFRLVPVDHYSTRETPRALHASPFAKEGAGAMTLEPLDMLDLAQEWILTTVPRSLPMLPIIKA